MADRPYGEWLKASYRRKEVGAEPSAHRPPATKKTPETTTAITAQTGGDAINGIKLLSARNPEHSTHQFALKGHVDLEGKQKAEILGEDGIQSCNAAEQSELGRTLHGS